MMVCRSLTCENCILDISHPLVSQRQPKLSRRCFKRPPPPVYLVLVPIIYHLNNSDTQFTMNGTLEGMKIFIPQISPSEVTERPPHGHLARHRQHPLFCPKLRKLFEDLDKTKVRVWALTNSHKNVRPANRELERVLTNKPACHSGT